MIHLAAGALIYPVASLMHRWTAPSCQLPRQTVGDEFVAQAGASHVEIESFSRQVTDDGEPNTGQLGSSSSLVAEAGR